MLLRNMGSIEMAVPFLNAGSVKGVRYALQGMSREAIVATSSMMGLNAAQTAGLLSADGFTAAEIAEALATKGAGREVVKKALQNLGYEGTELDAALATATFTAAENAEIVATNTLTASLQKATIGMIKFLTTNPAGWAIMAAAAIFVLVKAFDYVNKAQDRAIERAQQAQDAYDDSVSQMDSLQSKLDEVNNKISEINSNGPLNITDQKQLSLLEAERQELERELEIQSMIARLNKSEEASAAHEALNTKKIYTGKDDNAFYGVGSMQGGRYARYHIIDKQSEEMGQSVIPDKALTTTELAEAQYNQLERLKAQRSAYVTSVESELSSMTAAQIKQYNKNLQTFQSAIAQQERALATTMTELRTERARLIDDATGQAIAGYENDVQQIDDLLDQLVVMLKDANAEINEAQEQSSVPLSMTGQTRAAFTAYKRQVDTSWQDKIAAFKDEKQRIADWGFEASDIVTPDGNFVRTRFGNVDMDKRVIINWSRELKDTWRNELASWNYDPEIGGIDTVFGGSDRFGTDILGLDKDQGERGVTVAYTPIVNDDANAKFLSQQTVYDYIEELVADATKDGVLNKDLLFQMDRDGRQVGDAYVHGIIAAIDETPEDETNPLNNKAVQAGYLMHFSGDYGAIKLAGDNGDAWYRQYEAMLQEENEKASFTWDYETEKNGIDALNSAIKESTEATGIGADTIKELTSRYAELDSFNPEALFTRTANGFRLNSDEAQRLEQELSNATNTGFEDKLSIWMERLADVDDQLDNTTDLTREQIDALMEERDRIVENIQETRDLATSYASLTSNYKKWLDAQDSGEEGDMYDTIVKGYSNAKELFDKGLVGTNEFREYVDLLSSADLSNASVDEIVAEWDKLNKINETTGFAPLDYLSEGSAGVENFIAAVQKAESEWVSFDEETGQWSIDVEDLQKLSDELGLDDEMVEALLKKVNDYGHKAGVVTKDEFGNVVSSIEGAIDTLGPKLEENKLELDFDTTNVTTAGKQLTDFQKIYADFLDEDGHIKLDSEEAKAAYTIMGKLWGVWAQLTHHNTLIYNVDSSTITESSSDATKLLGAIDKVVEAKEKLAEAEIRGLDTEELQKDCDTAIEELNTLYGSLDKKTKDGLGVTIKGDITDENISEILGKFDAVSADIWLDVGADKNLVQQWLDEDGKDTETALRIAEGQNYVENWLKEHHETDVSVKPELLAFNTWLSEVPTKHVNVVENLSGGDNYQGTAHAQGHWGLSRKEHALTGELGMEMYVDVRTGRWHTIGTNGAEFVDLPQGAIIFNHKQTEQLLKYGHINSRGRALASGTAHATDKKFTGFTGLSSEARGETVTGKGPLQQAASTTASAASSVAKSVSSASKSVSSSAQQSADTVDDVADKSEKAIDSFKDEISKLTDWVEKVLENIEKKTEQYLSKAEKKVEVGNFAGAARQYRKAEKSYAEEISRQSSAESIYMAQANKILQSAVSKGIISAQQSASIQDKVANGSMNVSKVGENTREVIDAYQEYYDKAVAAAEATTELYNKFQEVAEKMYQLPLDKAEAQLDKLKNSYDLLEKKIELTNSTSKKAALMEKELENLRKQHAVTAKAAAAAEANYEAARKKVDAVDDKALRGLSDAMRAKVTAQIAKNMAIDVTALTGLTADGQRAILNYNAALAAQQEAQYNAKVSALETAASMRELAAAIANQPVEKAEAKIEKIDKGVEVLDAQLEVADSRQDRKKLLRQQIRAAKKEADARKTAVSDIRGNIKESWQSNKDLRKEARKQGKKRGEKLSLAGIDESSDLYKEIVEYNAHIDALPEAIRQSTLASLNATKTLRENTAQMYDDFKGDLERGAQGIVDEADAAEKAYGDLNKSAVKMMEDDPTLTYDQAVLKVLGNAQTAYEAQAEKYKSMADKLQAWLEKNRDNLSAEQIQTIEDDIKNYNELASDSMDKVDDLATEVKTYIDEQTKRDADKAQTVYDASHRLNEEKQANGKLLTRDDYAQELASAIDLSVALDARIAALREQLKDVVPGSEEWEKLQSDLESTENSSISLTKTIGELKDGLRELDAKPLENQLNVLKNEQKEIQDRINLTQAAGDDAAVTDYYGLINNSRQQVEVLKQQLAEQKALLATLDETDEKYEEVQQRVWDIEAAIRQAEIDQAGWNKSADDLLKKQRDEEKDAEDKAHKRRLNEIKLVLEQLAAKLNDIYDRMDLLKAKGITPSYTEYLKAYEVNQQRMEELQKEITELEAEYYRVRSDEEDEDGSQRLAAYQEWQGAIKEYNDLMAENIELVRVTMRDAILKPLQDEHDRLEHIAAVFEGLADIIDNDMLFNQNGTVSRYGTMKMDLLAGQYQAARSEVQNYQDDIKVINKLIATGYYSAEEGAAQLSEAQEKLISAMKEQKSLASELADTLKESHEQELEQLGKIIDARKEALQAKRDYYDYDKTIRAQTKDIQALQAQIAALEGMTDAESKAKRARLQSQLTEAQEILDDTLQEHMFEISQDSLDELQTVLEKSFEEEWDLLSHDLDALIKYANDLADNTDPESIEGAMRNIFETFDVDATATQFEGIFDAMMEERHKNPYDDAVYKSVLDDIYYTLVELKRMGALSSGINPDMIYDETASAIAASEHVNTNNNASVVGGSEDSAAQEQTKPFIEVLKETFAQISEWFNNLKSKFKLPGFARGTKGVSRSGLAWTQEFGKDEWIVRKSDGAILTPLSRGDGVLPADITSKLYAMAMGNLPQMQVPKLNMPDYNVFDSYAPVVNIDSSITVEGSVDATVISDMKKFRDETREDMYQYISDKMYRGYIHSGGKRRL